MVALYVNLNNGLVSLKRGYLMSIQQPSKSEADVSTQEIPYKMVNCRKIRTADI